MGLRERLQRWWQIQTHEEDTPFDGDAPAWVVSIVVQVSLILVLGLLWVDGKEDDYQLLISNDLVEEKLELNSDEVYFSEDVKDEIGANSVDGEDAAAALAQMESEVSELTAPEYEAEVGSFKEIENVVASVGPTLSMDKAVRGTASGAGETGAEGAIDRITHEILLSIERRQTLVVWVFDQSKSLMRQRSAISSRFDRIYDELGVLEAANNPAFRRVADKPLLTAVMSFGREVNFLLPQPTDNYDEIKGAVELIQNDDSGIENVFSAVYSAAQRYRKYRQQAPRRNVMIVVVTDEAGDDQEGLDQTIAMCRRYQLPVYVIGVPAPFGRAEVPVKYVDPDPKYDQTPQWIDVRQGPETLLPERVNIGFMNGTRFDSEIDSGFGPYSLTRLCYETNGIYFAVHPNRNTTRTVDRRETAELSAHISQFFNPRIMQKYRPDYVTASDYLELLNENKARRALVEASKVSWTSSLRSPRLRFVKTDEATFINDLTAAQQQAAMIEPQLDRIQTILETGKKDRDSLLRLRWQAGYDLAMGRTKAVLTRTRAYNVMLAKAKQGMKFSNKKMDTWVLRPSNSLDDVGSSLAREAKEAEEYLNRVIKEHSGTPWAFLAKKELSQKIGWKWVELDTVPEPAPPGAVAPAVVNNVVPVPPPPPPPRQNQRANMLKKPKNPVKPRL